MGRLIIDGNSFFEIDEECIKKKKILPNCGLDKYLKEKDTFSEKKNRYIETKKKRGDG